MAMSEACVWRSQYILRAAADALHLIKRIQHTSNHCNYRLLRSPAHVSPQAISQAPFIMAAQSTLRFLGATPANERPQLPNSCSPDQILYSLENPMAPPCVLDQPVFAVSHFSADLHTHHMQMNETTRPYIGYGREKPMDGPKVWHCSECGDGPYGSWQPCCQACGHGKCSSCVENT
jgi:hypothetical protein